MICKFACATQRRSDSSPSVFFFFKFIHLSREFSLNFPESVDRIVGGYLNWPICRISAQLWSFDSFKRAGRSCSFERKRYLHDSANSSETIQRKMLKF